MVGRMPGESPQKYFIMRETINNLSKGIVNTLLPKITIVPASGRGRFPVDGEFVFDMEITSSNGQSIRGACFSDSIKVRPNNNTFAGRRSNLSLLVDTHGLRAKQVLEGNIVFLTNGGEIIYPYRFEIIARSDELKNPEKRINIKENPLRYFPARENAPASCAQAKYPEDEEVFMEMLKDMIRSKDESIFAFETYKEAIKRNLSVTHLYESYLDAYPVDYDEKMPREVLLYFSYDYNLNPEECEKLFSDISRFEDPKSELFESFSARMSSFAMANALKSRINNSLVPIYNRMILDDMVDQRAAKVLPDLLTCHLIKVEDESATFLLVSFPGLRETIKADITDKTAWVPVYFDDAVFTFYSGDAETAKTAYTANTAEIRDMSSHRLNDVRYTDTKLFEKPEVLYTCSRLVPGHVLFLVGDCRDIVEKGIKDGLDKNRVIEALKSRFFDDSFRNKLIEALCNEKGDMSWLNLLDAADFNQDTLGLIFNSLLKTERYEDAYRLIKNYGTDFADVRDIATLTEKLILRLPGDNYDEDITRLSKLVFDSVVTVTSKPITEYLSKTYNGSIADMLKLESYALKNNVNLHDLAERIISFELFSGNYDDIDKAFKVYLAMADPNETIIRAYLYVRCDGFFIKDEPVDKRDMMDALEGYLMNLEDPADVPVILPITLTSYYADRDELSDLEIGLCQKLTDYLISEGYIFRYTKKLRKKIHIPEEIGWKYYIEYKCSSGKKPLLLIRILPDEEKYREADMKLVYKNIFVMSMVLFTGDELHYLIYEGDKDKQPDAQGIIKVTKLHEKGDERMKYINHISEAIERRDARALSESMLKYVKHIELARRLFTLEGV